MSRGGSTAPARPCPRPVRYSGRGWEKTRALISHATPSHGARPRRDSIRHLIAARARAALRIALLAPISFVGARAAAETAARKRSARDRGASLRYPRTIRAAASASRPGSAAETLRRGRSVAGVAAAIRVAASP